jgi:hypothetical protein
MDTTIAETIYQQIGGRRFRVMTGAKKFVAHSDGCSFRLPGNPGYTKAGINYVRITLNDLDLYDVEYGRIWGMKRTTKRQAHNLYAENLLESFRETTGLETRMPRVVGI